jgi:hypothetical protein
LEENVWNGTTETALVAAGAGVCAHAFGPAVVAVGVGLGAGVCVGVAVAPEPGESVGVAVARDGGVGPLDPPLHPTMTRENRNTGETQERAM